MLPLRPADKRLDFASIARTYSDGSVLLHVVSKSAPDILLGVIIESILDKLEALGSPSLLDLLIMSVYSSDISMTEAFPSPVASFSAGRYSTSKLYFGKHMNLRNPATK